MLVEPNNMVHMNTYYGTIEQDIGQLIHMSGHIVRPAYPYVWPYCNVQEEQYGPQGPVHIERDQAS